MPTRNNITATSAATKRRRKAPSPARSRVKKNTRQRAITSSQENSNGSASAFKLHQGWQYHPYRSFIEGLPIWLSILTCYMFAVVYIQSWTYALVFTLIVIVMVSLLFDLLHNLHNHLQIPRIQRDSYNAWLTRFGRVMLVIFGVFFLVLFLFFAFSFEQPDTLPFIFGTFLTLLGIGLVFFLVIGYIALIIFLGFPRIRHQLSLAALLFFCYFYLYFAFAVRRIEF